MSPLRLTALAGVVFLLAFGIGLAMYFPGQAVSRYVSQRAERAAGVPVRLSPISIGLTGLSAATLEVRPADGASFVVHDLHVPWTWRWVSEFPISARIGPEGRVDVDWSWSGDLSVTAKGVPLQDLPLPMLPRETKVQGTLDASLRAGPLALRQGTPREVPAGQLEVRAEALEVSNLRVAGTALPPVRIDVLDAKVGLGRTLQVESVTLRGDVQGTVSGTVVPNLDRPSDSRISLNVSLQVQNAWLDRLGEMRPLAEGFLPGGRFEGIVEGTVAAPILNRNGKRS
ncbi:MAG: type II secretion system protein GspN [SAR324 cluster bacterium]